MTEMAAEVATADKMTILKNTKILVNVEEAIADILVVSYLNEDKTFQGVLLDSSKRDLPFGITNLHPVFDNQPKPSNDDRLFSVNQRFVYVQPNYKFEVKTPQKSKPQPRAKMTVRLRPRKVLCSKCKGVCNENSENVELGRKRKNAERESSSRDKKPYLSVNSAIAEDNKTLFMGHSLIPKLSRLRPSEISSALNGSVANRHEIWLKTDEDEFAEAEDRKRSPNGETDIYSKTDYASSDILSETKDENGTDEKNSANGLFSNARTLKISFGEGEGTVVKIPAIANEETFANGEGTGRAAKKAHKKAKKHARKRITLPPLASPRRSAAASPGYGPTATVPQRRHRHKVKHKKKRRIDRKLHRESEEEAGAEARCAERKLSISLKRLSANSYAKNEEGLSSNGSWDAWDEEGCRSDVPDFPEEAPGRGAGGGAPQAVRARDVVWGKVSGFPWWPGRVLEMRPGGAEAHVSWYASSTSSLMPLSNLTPFLSDYKVRFNKKKRGPYKEAVKQATLDAQREETDLCDSSVQDPLASPTALSALSPRPIDVLS